MISPVFALTLWQLIERGWQVLLRNYTWYVVRPLEQDLILRSMEAAILIGIVSGVVGSLVVVRGMSFFGDALAHSILPGVAFMYQRSQTGDVPDFMGERRTPLLWGGLIAGIFSALTIGFLTRQERLRNDTAIGIVFAGMFALGIAMIARIENSSVDLTEILFGQILGVTVYDLQLTFFFSALIVGVVVVFYKEFMLVSFDLTLAKTLRLPTEVFRFLLLILIAVTIVISLQTVGAALMMALLVIPAATASLITHRLHWMMVLAALIGTACSIIGFYVSYHFDVVTGPAIVLTAATLFIFVFAEQNLLRFAALWLVRGKTAWKKWIQPLVASTSH